MATLLGHLRCRLPAAIRCTAGAPAPTPSFARMRCYSSKPSRFGAAKKRTQVLEKARSALSACFLPPVQPPPVTPLGPGSASALAPVFCATLRDSQDLQPTAARRPALSPGVPP